MSWQRCAELVERGDLDRFITTYRAAEPAKRVLFPLYAFNLEVARAPWVTQEAHIAEMRLQWWRDALGEIAADGQVRRHEVVTPLSEVLDADGAALLDKLIAARRWDIYRDTFENKAHFQEYLDATSGHLMWSGVRLLGGGSEEVVRDAAFAIGLAKWFLAVPELEAQGRKPLVDGRAEAVQALAEDAQNRLTQARSNRKGIAPTAIPAMMPVWQAGNILRQVIKDPRAVGEGRLVGDGPMARLPGLLRMISGRW